MFEQQLQVSKEELQNESKVDWSRIKKLYTQSVQRIDSPEPDSQVSRERETHMFSQKDVEVTFAEIMKEVQMKNSQEMSALEQHFQEEISSLKDRVEKLEELLLYSLNPKFQATVPKPKGESVKAFNHQKQLFATPTNRPKQKQTETTQLKQTKSKELIYIEDQQEHEISLLDDEEPSHTVISPRGKSKRKSHQRTVSNAEAKRKHIPEFSQILEQFDEKKYEYQPENKIYTVDCIFHEEMLKNMSQELATMKKYLEQTHKVTIDQIKQDQSNGILKNTALSQKSPEKVVLNLSSNEHQHLMNENTMLRQRMQKYKKELYHAKGEVKVIKNILKHAIQVQNQKQL